VTELDAIVFVLSGELDADHSVQLGDLLEAEAPNQIRLDLKDVTLVDRTGVRFLARVDAAGIALINCPDYIRSWVAAEKES
jgi:ABC-type transporter Mla MlaB component